MKLTGATAGGTFIVRGKSYDPPPGVFWGVDPSHIPADKFQNVVATRAFRAEDTDTQISFAEGETLVVTFQQDGATFSLRLVVCATYTESDHSGRLFSFFSL